MKRNEDNTFTSTNCQQKHFFFVTDKNTKAY